MTDINTTIANYIAAWNETDSDKRRDVIARTWTEAGSYLDCHRDSTGHDAIDGDDRGGPADVSRLPLPPVERHR